MIEKRPKRDQFGRQQRVAEFFDEFTTEENSHHRWHDSHPHALGSTWDYFDSDTSGRRPAGFHFFLTPPQPKSVKEVFGYVRFPHMAHVRRNDVQL
jgi:hypothetical protein